MRRTHDRELQENCGLSIIDYRLKTKKSTIAFYQFPLMGAASLEVEVCDTGNGLHAEGEAAALYFIEFEFISLLFSVFPVH